MAFKSNNQEIDSSLKEGFREMTEKMSLIQETMEAVLNENHELKIKIESIETKMTTNSTTSPIRKKAHKSRNTELVSNEVNNTNAFGNLIEQNVISSNDNFISTNDNLTQKILLIKIICAMVLDI